MASFSGIKLNITTIVIAIVVLLFLVGLGWYFYRQGKKKTAIQALPGDLPGNPGSGSQTGASNDEIKRLANAIYSDIDGFNVLGHVNEPYKNAILLSDTDIVKLYNAFNAMYQEKLGETLTQAIDNEKYWENDAPDTLIERLKKLNCP